MAPRKKTTRPTRKEIVNPPMVGPLPATETVKAENPPISMQVPQITKDQIEAAHQRVIAHELKANRIKLAGQVCAGLVGRYRHSPEQVAMQAVKYADAILLEIDK